MMATSNLRSSSPTEDKDEDSRHQVDQRVSVDPQEARQGEIILKKPVQRWIFFGALAAAAILGVVFTVLAGS